MKCFVKYFVSYCLLTAILFLGIASASFNHNEVIANNNKLTEQQPLPSQPVSFFCNCDFSIPIGLGNGQNILLGAVQTISTGAVNSVSNTARINHLIQVQHQKFAVEHIRYLLQSAYKQRNGYYLYHLRKLLI